MRPTWRRHQRDRDAGTLRWGHEVSIGYFPQDAHGRDREGHDGGRVAAPVRSRRVAPGDPRPARPDALQRRRRATSRPMRSRAARPRGCCSAASCCRSRTCSILDEPTNHLDLEAINALNIALQKLRGHRAARHARPGPARGSRHARSGSSIADASATSRTATKSSPPRRRRRV